jgi:hypothetical protein
MAMGSHKEVVMAEVSGTRSRRSQVWFKPADIGSRCEEAGRNSRTNAAALANKARDALTSDEPCVSDLK